MLGRGLPDFRGTACDAKSAPFEICDFLFDCISLTATHFEGVTPCLPNTTYGIAIAAILVLLLGMFLQRWLGTRFVVLHKSSGTDQLANQLSRIADSLEKLLARSAVSPVVEERPIEKVAVPIQKAPQPTQEATEPARESGQNPPPGEPPKTDQPVERHVSFLHVRPLKLRSRPTPSSKLRPSEPPPSRNRHGPLGLTHTNFSA